jgi:hypothetical protein
MVPHASVRMPSSRQGLSAPTATDHNKESRIDNSQRMRRQSVTGGEGLSGRQPWTNKTQRKPRPSRAMNSSPCRVRHQVQQESVAISTGSLKVNHWDALASRATSTAEVPGART